MGKWGYVCQRAAAEEKLHDLRWDHRTGTEFDLRAMASGPISKARLDRLMNSPLLFPPEPEKQTREQVQGVLEQ